MAAEIVFTQTQGITVNIRRIPASTSYDENFLVIELTTPGHGTVKYYVDEKEDLESIADGFRLLANNLDRITAERDYRTAPDIYAEAAR